MPPSNDGEEVPDRAGRKIAASLSTAIGLIDRIQREVPDDRLASTRALRFEPTAGAVVVCAAGAEFHQRLHRHAFSQVAERAGVPDVFVTRLLTKPSGPALLADNLNQIREREDERRLLLRSVRGEVRAVLSDTYRRMDSRPIVEALDAKHRLLTLR